MKKNPLIPIVLIVFADVLALTIILPLFPFYAQKYGASPLTVGALVSIFAFCQFFSGPILGKWSDRYGRKPVLILSQIGTFIGLLIIGFAQSLFALFLGRIIDGITAGNLTVANAAISDVTPPKDRVRAFGIIGMVFGFGLLVGPAISGLLVPFGINAPIFAAAGFSLVSILATFFLLPEKQPEIQNPPPNQKKSIFIPIATWKKFLTHPDLKIFLLQFFCFHWIFASFLTGFPLFAERSYQWDGQNFGAREVSIIFAAFGAYGILMQGYVVSRLNRSFGEKKLVIIGFSSCIAAYIILSGASNFAILGVALLISGFGTGILRPAITALMSLSADKSEQGLVIGIGQSLASLAQILAPLLSGWLISGQYLTGWCWSMSITGLLALWIASQKKSSSSVETPSSQ